MFHKFFTVFITGLSWLRTGLGGRWPALVTVVMNLQVP